MSVVDHIGERFPDSPPIEIAYESRMSRRMSTGEVLLLLCRRDSLAKKSKSISLYAVTYV
jgi:hypothetical protein